MASRRNVPGFDRSGAGRFEKASLRDRNAVRQVTAGLDREDAALENERRRLLEERRRYFRETEAEEGEEPLASPKFNEPTSQPSHKARNGGFSKFHQLEELLNQIVRDSSRENAEVQHGLANLRDAHIRIIRNLEGENNGARQSRKPSREKGYGHKFRELTAIVDSLMRDCQIEDEGVRRSLRNIKDLQEQAEYEFETANHRRGRSEYGRHRRTTEPIAEESDNQWKKKHEAEIRELAPELLISDSSNEAGGVEKIEPDNSAPSSVPSIREQLGDLDDLESRIFYEVLTLRDQKIKILNDLNEEIKHSNSLARELKRLERETGRGGHRHEDSENESIINKLGHDGRRADTENIKLREKVRRLEAQLDRAYNNPKDQSTRISAGYEKTIAKLETALNNADAQINELRRINSDLQNRAPARRTEDNQTSVLREKIRNLEARLREEQDKYAQLEATVGDYGSLQENILKLREQNEELRIETIRLLKSKETDTADLHSEIARLKKKIAESENSRVRFTDEIGGYIDRIRTGQDTVGRNYATYGSSTYGVTSKYGEEAGGVQIGGSYGGASYSGYGTDNYEPRFGQYRSSLDEEGAPNLNVY